MRKKTGFLIAVVLVLITTTALASDITTVAGVQSASRGIIGVSTIYMGASGPIVEAYVQAEILDENYNSYAFGRNSRSNTSITSLSAYADAYNGVLSTGGYYHVQAYGWYTWQTSVGTAGPVSGSDTYYFTYNGYKSMLPVSVMQAEVSAVSRNYQETRAQYFMRELGIAYAPYEFAEYTDLFNFVSISDAQEIRTLMNIGVGASAPVFYVNESGSFMYGLTQDAEAVVHVYQFTKGPDGTWSLALSQSLQKDQCYHEAVQTFSQYKAKLESAK